MCLLTALFLSSCQLELGSFKTKQPPPVASSEVNITSINEIADREIDAVVAMAEGVTEYGAWPTQRIQTFLMTFNVDDVIPNIIISTRVFAFEEQRDNQMRLHIVIFGENPVLIQTIGHAHLDLNWTAITSNDVEGSIAVQAPSKKVKFYATPEPAREGEETMPALTMFVYVIEVAGNGGDSSSAPSSVHSSVPSSGPEVNPFSDLKDGTQDDVNTLLSFGENILKVEHWPYGIILNELTNHGRNDFIANYEIHHDIYYQIYVNYLGYDALSLALLGDNPHLVMAMAEPYKNSSDWLTVRDGVARAEFKTIDEQVFIEFHFHDLDDLDGMPRGLYMDLYFVND